MKIRNGSYRLCGANVLFPSPRLRGEGAERASAREAGEGLARDSFAASPSPGSHFALLVLATLSPQGRGEGRFVSVASSRVFYGWYVVYAVGLVMTTTAGLVFYNLPVLLDAFVRERAFPVSLASAATAMFFVASSFSGLAAGRFVDRHDPRRVILVAACGATLALASIGWLYQPWQLFAFYLFFGLCYGGCGLVPTTAIVARWFAARRAMAMSIASTGLSLGGIVFTPLAAYLIQRQGLAGAAPWIALALFLGVVPAIVFVVRSNPESMGLQPDGVARHEVAAAEAVAPSVAFADAWRSRFFLAVGGTYLFALGAQVGGIAHIYRLASLRADAETAALSVAVLASASLVGRLVAGRMLAVMSSRAMTNTLMVVQTLGLVLLGLVAGRWPILLCIVLFGLTAGSMLMMQPLLLAEAFGVRDYGRIYSTSLSVGVVGYIIAPTLMGILFDATDSYTLPYLLAAGLTLIGMGTFALAGTTKPSS
jgi:MFS family permease